VLGAVATLLLVREVSKIAKEAIGDLEAETYVSAKKDDDPGRKQL
jgi:hypothetical protein